ncbi:MAG: YggS family pyridoxal phosphate-dependent enzyme [Sphingobacteriales bacterium]|nr:YggS family pyridoxal phosphate-dependent enzyme [Sphingobacteriales bacterium]
MFNAKAYQGLIKELEPYKATLVAVSKKKPADDVTEAMVEGQMDFGENYVQELVEKKDLVSRMARWHFIGHLQSNKVKMIASCVHLIQGVDSVKLLSEINKEGKKNGRIIDCLLQVHIASEETKFGFSEAEAESLLLFPELAEMTHVRIRGLMGMASLTEDTVQVRKEFHGLHSLYLNCKMMSMDPEAFNVLSMGMSGDYRIALDCGSNMIRIGSMLFGVRS